MKFFNWIFRKKIKNNVPTVPSWKTIIEMMYDKYLDAFANTVVKVIYSKDRSMRYVILKDENGLFTYQLEAIYQHDEDDWKYICLHDNALPAMWEPFRGILGSTLFENIEELLRDMKSEPEYKKYF